MYIITCSRNRLHEYPTWKFAEFHPLQNIYGDIGDMSCHFRIMVGLSRTMIPKLPHSPNSVTLRLIVRSRDTLLFHFEDEILFFERSFHLNFYCAHHDLSNAPSHDLLRKLYFFLYHYGAYTWVPSTYLVILKFKYWRCLNFFNISLRTKKNS